MNKKLVLWPVLVLVVMLIVWGVQAERPVEVKTLQLLRGDIEFVIRVTGKVINDRTVTLTALVDGQIKSMRVHKGENVKAGQVLAVLDDREADAVLNKIRNGNLITLSSWRSNFSSSDGRGCHQ